MELKDVVVTVERVEGKCVVYKGGERIYFRGPEIDLSKSDRICYHALTSILHYINAFRINADCGREFGLSKPEMRGVGYVSCLDPGPPYTNGGRAIFRIEAVESTDVVEK